MNSGFMARAAGDGHALLLPAGELVGVGMRPRGPAHHLQELQALVVGLPPRSSLQSHRPEHNVLDDHQVREEVEGLEDHPHLCAQLVDIGPPVEQATPSTTIWPAVGASSRLMQRSSVLLPVPDGPMTEITSPLHYLGFTSLRTSGQPKRLARCCTLITAPPPLHNDVFRPFGSTGSLPVSRRS